jgi:uncharacterized linocin/CFP29 family protein
MDILKRNLAPLSEAAWKEIDSRAQEVLKSNLSARRVLNVNGPKGWDFTVLSEGRLDDIVEGEVCTGTYKVKPLIEARINFTLDRWEMDNIIRGAKDIDLSSLEEAAKKLALFEENAVYKGYPQGNIDGLENESAHEKISLGNDSSSIMESITQGLLTLQDNFVEGPFSLVVGREAWKRINVESQGYPLIKRIENLLGGKIILSNVVEGGLLLPFNNENLEFTIGQDFAIGYESSNDKEVRLFISESFTLRVLDKNIIITFTI